MPCRHVIRSVDCTGGANYEALDDWSLVWSEILWMSFKCASMILLDLAWSCWSSVTNWSLVQCDPFRSTYDIHMNDVIKIPEARIQPRIYIEVYCLSLVDSKRHKYNPVRALLPCGCRDIRSKKRLCRGGFFVHLVSATFQGPIVIFLSYLVGT